ncbi:AfsR/SARP family transcriptional regulator [Sphaerisporangium corydalis]|uniref:BTAD domain-containing putative transcriptional regulator n=1 Tax=Sphaerisporangium corydalis TaxID=1441875 RepID=A0ABV9ERJ4_9ACTN|nr:BTAD domain-containing putative transcriptional regulator [Sphaerisporangium corydalis]
MIADQPTFTVLGPLDVRAARSPRLGGTKPRMLLATLLLHANRVVGTGFLVEVLWPGPRPRSAVENVRTYVSSLRAGLAEAGVRAPIRARQSGYMIEVAPGELDLLGFEELTAGARLSRAEGRTAEAVDRLCRALALWRGAPLADLPGSPLWDGRLGPLADARLAAAEELLALRVALGQHASAISELRGLLVEHPFREGLWRQLMLALHGSGRQAEALRAYTTIRDRLVAELGIEPGAELREAHATVLAGAPPPGARSARPTPYQLPPDVPDFTGRAGDVAAVIETLAPRAAAGPPSITLVVGPPGVGKSALAVHCAHAVRDACPDGQLYLDLGGTSLTPPGPGELLAEALRALGVAEGALPDGVQERSALYRSLLAGRAVLVVLDDAAGAAQVRPLLPGSGGSVLVTSRRRITELPGTRQVELDVLAQEEAEELLRRIVGGERLNRERDAAAAIVRSCGRLPLAVRIAGARLVARPAWSLRVLERRLDDEAFRLGELRAGDLGVRASVDRSYRLLPDAAARALRTLGLLGPQTLPGWVVDAVLDRHRSDEVVDHLVDASLLRTVGGDPLGGPRYRLHDLIRCDARERARADPEGHALGRVVGAWLAIAERATARLPTTVFGLMSPTAERWEPAESTVGQMAVNPLAWFDTEREALLGTVRLAADAGMADSAWGLAATLVPYFDLRGHYDAWRSTHQIALDAVRAKGDPRGEAALLRGLAQVYLYQDAYPEAADMFRRSLMIFREVGDRRGEAIAICGLGAVDQVRGESLSALRRFRQALGMFLGMGDPAGEAYARQAIGKVCLESGDLAAAAGWLDEALRLARSLGDRHREGCVFNHFGRLHDLAADFDRAMHFQDQALDIFESLGDCHCAAYAMQSLGRRRAVRGDRAHASAQLERSRTIFQRLGDRSGEASATRMLGELHRAAGRADLARDYLRQASTLQRALSSGAHTPGEYGT